jgi:hypothetical protein
VRRGLSVADPSYDPVVVEAALELRAVAAGRLGNAQKKRDTDPTQPTSLRAAAATGG